MDRIMMSFLDDDNLILIFLFCVAIVVVCLFIHLVIKMLSGGDRKSSYISRSNKQTFLRPNGFNDNYFNSTKGRNAAMNAYGNRYGNQGTPSTSGHNHADIIQNNEEQSDPTDNGFSEYARAEQEKIYVRKSTNEDGTPKTEIDFGITAEEPAPVPFTPKYEYLTTANEGKFLKLLPTDEKSFFRTWVENGVRLFQFHGNTAKALANFNAVFDDVCEIVEGKQNGATQIINGDPGVLDSNLKVETKAKIKLA